MNYSLIISEYVRNTVIYFVESTQLVFQVLFVGGVDVANSGLSHLLGVGRCSLPRSYHLDCPALRYTNTNRNRGPVILQPLPRGQTD